jgi:protein SCO1/2
MNMRSLLRAVVVVVVVAPAGAAQAVERLPSQLRDITVKEKLGKLADLDARFTDHDGKAVTLRDYLDGERPVLLTLNYYRCPTLCSIQLNALTRALRKLEWAPGENYRIVTVSIDHREKPKLARKKRASYLSDLRRGADTDWSFLVGAEPMVKRIAGSVGFGFRYDPEQDQYAHPAVAIFLSPRGKISRYIYGLEFDQRDLKFALMEASEGKVGSTVDKLILSCFHYDATTGRYGPWAFGIMRLGGGATVLLLGAFLVVLWRRERHRRTRTSEQEWGGAGGVGARADGGEDPPSTPKYGETM